MLIVFLTQQNMQDLTELAIFVNQRCFSIATIPVWTMISKSCTCFYELAVFSYMPKVVHDVFPF